MAKAMSSGSEALRARLYRACPRRLEDDMCKYCFYHFGRHATWCPGYEYFTEEEEEQQAKVQEGLRRQLGK